MSLLKIQNYLKIWVFVDSDEFDWVDVRYEVASEATICPKSTKAAVLFNKRISLTIIVALITFGVGLSSFISTFSVATGYGVTYGPAIFIALFRTAISTYGTFAPLYTKALCLYLTFRWLKKVAKGAKWLFGK